jgi:hypothetical protein
MEGLTTNGAVEVVRNRTGKSGRSSGHASAIHIRASSDWVAWVKEFAESDQRLSSSLIEHALLMLAKKKGFKPPPKR